MLFILTKQLHCDSHSIEEQLAIADCFMLKLFIKKTTKIENSCVSKEPKFYNHKLCPSVLMQLRTEMKPPWPQQQPLLAMTRHVFSSFGVMSSMLQKLTMSAFLARHGLFSKHNHLKSWNCQFCNQVGPDPWIFCECYFLFSCNKLSCAGSSTGKMHSMHWHDNIGIFTACDARVVPLFGMEQTAFWAHHFSTSVVVHVPHTDLILQTHPLFLFQLDNSKKWVLSWRDNSWSCHFHASLWLKWWMSGSWLSFANDTTMTQHVVKLAVATVSSKCRDSWIGALCPSW